jgi:hypothetical protein
MAPHPWLQPFPRRVAVAAICALWLALEAWHAPGGIWFWLALAATGWALWDFFLSGNYRGNG